MVLRIISAGWGVSPQNLALERKFAQPLAATPVDSL
jgi:hypothetical protein